MKIIYITNSRIPTEKAHGWQICKMCEEFANVGVKVELWHPARKNDIRENIFDFYNIKDNFKVKKIKSFDFLRFHRYLGKISFWLQSLFFLIKLFFKNIDKDKDAIIYTRNIEVGWFFNLKKFKVVCEAHTWPESKVWLYIFLNRKIDKIVVVTKAVKRLYLKHNFCDDKILVAPDGVDLEKFDIKISREEARKKTGLPLDKNLIIYAGHLYDWKGTQILADSADFLSRSDMIIFVGGTKEDLKKFRAKNKNHKNILIIGQVNRRLVPLYLKSADILVLPNSSKSSISKFYTSPMKLFEYMAVRRPIIASNLPSIREILNSGNAVLVEPDNSKSLANGIKKILQNKELGDIISGQAYQDVRKYTWRKRVKNILEFIKII